MGQSPENLAVVERISIDVIRFEKNQVKYAVFTKFESCATTLLIIGNKCLTYSRNIEIASGRGISDENRAIMLSKIFFCCKSRIILIMNLMIFI